MLRILLAARNTWNGLVAAARSEAAVRQELALVALGLPLAFVLGAGLWQRVALIGSLLLVICVEMLNTSVEKLSDHVTPETHPGIGRIKDMASAAVGFALLIAALVWAAALGEFFGLL